MLRAVLLLKVSGCRDDVTTRRCAERLGLRVDPGEPGRRYARALFWRLVGSSSWYETKLAKKHLEEARKDPVEISSEDFAGERLVVCRNPLLAEERCRKRSELLAATEKKLEEVVTATKREKRALRGKDKIGLRVGRLLNKYKMAKHFLLEIGETEFSFRPDEEKIAAVAALDGLYVIRTSVPEESLDAWQVFV